VASERFAYRNNDHPHSPDARVAALAERQHGVVTTAQLVEAGLSRAGIRRRVQGRRLFPLYRGVYAVGHRALTPRSRLIAAVYACGPNALASHRAAGSLHGLVSAGRIEVTTSRGCRPRPGIEVHTSRVVHDDDRHELDAIPVTGLARTLVDLADVLTEERLAKAVHRAEVLRVFDLKGLERAQARAGGRPGRHRLNRVLAAYQPEPHLLRSKAERRLKALCRRAGLPMPLFNAVVAGHEVDAYWPEANFVLEVDGAETHDTTYAFHSDRRRDRALAAEGIQVVRVTWPDLDAGLVRQVKEILARR
jgi:very-short-patch-repair endonuclease